MDTKGYKGYLQSIQIPCMARISVIQGLPLSQQSYPRIHTITLHATLLNSTHPYPMEQYIPLTGTVLITYNAPALCLVAPSQSSPLSITANLSVKLLNNSQQYPSAPMLSRLTAKQEPLLCLPDQADQPYKSMIDHTTYAYVDTTNHTQPIFDPMTYDHRITK